MADNEDLADRGAKLKKLLMNGLHIHGKFGVLTDDEIKELADWINDRLDLTIVPKGKAAI